MLGVGVDLAEAVVHAVRDEHRVVAEALVAARGPHQLAVNLALEAFDRAVGPGQRQRAHEMRVAAGVGARGLDLGPDLFHPAPEVAVAELVFGPARGEDAGLAVECVDAEPAVVGERGEAAEVRRLARFELGIVDEGDASFFGFGQVKLCRPDARDPVRREQSANFAQLARVVSRDHQFGPDRLHRPVAFICAAKISVQPSLARRSRRSSASSSKVAPSAVN